MTLGPRNGHSGSAGTNESGPGFRSQKGIFRKAGWYWGVGLGGNEVRLKDARGLGYISYLLHHPDAEFHVLDLYGGIAIPYAEDKKSMHDLPRADEDLDKAGIHIAGLGDAGEMLDQQAKEAYRRRLSELHEELEDAKQLGKVERAEQVETEIDALTRELSRAVGLGGRSRRAASASERARQSITKAIKSALGRIAQSDATFGDLLSRCIKTGTFCSYRPDRDSPIAWEFTTTSIESPDRMPSENLTQVRIDRMRPSAAAPSVLPFSVAQRTPFVGRESESGVVRAAIDRACTGGGSFLMLGGGPGVGKTRLAIEMAEYATRNSFTCFLGRCYEREEPFPYLPFAQIVETMLAQAPSLDEFRLQIGDNLPELAQLAPHLRRVFPEIPAPLDLPAAQKQRYLFQSVAETLERAARIRPQLLILDDLHWADESTLALLNHLADRITELRLVIIGTYRDEYFEHSSALPRMLEQAIRLGVRPLKLGGLSKDSVAKMVHELSQCQIPQSLVNVIFQQSNGNPFFVEEVYRHLIEERKLFDSAARIRADLKIDEIDVPENVRLIIGRRLRRFSDSELFALSAAAVIGRSFSFQLLAAINQVDVDELFTVIDKAQRMGVILPSSEGPENPFTFAHELVRQTLLADISVARQQQLHSKVAAAMELLYQAAITEHAGEIADHLLRAGSFADGEALIRWLIRAGKAALEGVAFDEARANFESALSRVDKTHSHLRAELLSNIAIAERGLGRWEEAQCHWEQALEIFIALRDQGRIGKTCLQLVQVVYWTSGWRKAMEIAERSIGHLPDVRRDRALLLGIIGVGKAIEGELHAAQEAFSAAFASAEELSDDRFKGTLLAFRSQFNFYFLRLREALEDSRRSVELTPRGGLWGRAHQLRWMQAALYHLGCVQEATRIGEDLEPLATKIGYLTGLSFSRQMAAWVKFWKQADLTQLEDSLRRDLDANTDAGLNLFVSISREQLSIAEFLQGHWDKALHDTEAAWSHEAPTHFKQINVGLRFRLRAYSGDREGALALLNEHHEMFAPMGRANTYGAWALALLTIEGLAVLDERDRAAALYPLVRELIATGAICMVFISRFSQNAAGIAAAAARHWDAAEEHFRIALQQAESFPNQLEQAETRRFHAMMLLDRAASGDNETARTLLGEALETYRCIGMRRHIELTQALIEQTSG
jgi:tetratricopeptide (TPR) repeat protein